MVAFRGGDAKGLEEVRTPYLENIYLQVLQLGQFKHLGRKSWDSVPVQLQHQECASQIVKIPGFHGRDSVAVDIPVESLKLSFSSGEVKKCMRSLYETLVQRAEPLFVTMDIKIINSLGCWRPISTMIHIFLGKDWLKHLKITNMLEMLI